MVGEARLLVALFFVGAVGGRKLVEQLIAAARDIERRIESNASAQRISDLEIPQK
jgi:hypothetical protein